MKAVVLVKPAVPGNIGAVARVLKNFGLSRLLLIKPRCNHLSKEALDRASHAKEILENAKLLDWDKLRFDYVIGTTSIAGTDYNLRRNPISPQKLAEVLPEKARACIVFGPEDKGLLIDELAKCDIIVTIPTAKKYPAMNVPHAVAVVLYELAKNHRNLISHIKPASFADRERLKRAALEAVDRLDFATPAKRETQKRLWKRVIGKTAISKREVQAMLGFFKKVK